MFLRKVFVSHYCSIPFHLLDKETNEIVRTKGVYPLTLIEELYEGAFLSVRNFELAPFTNDSTLETLIADRIDKSTL